MASSQNENSKEQFVDIYAIKACLDELGDHAAANGLGLAANLIGAASRAIEDELVERKVRGGVTVRIHDPGYNA